MQIPLRAALFSCYFRVVKMKIFLSYCFFVIFPCCRVDEHHNSHISCQPRCSLYNTIALDFYNFFINVPEPNDLPKTEL